MGNSTGSMFYAFGAFLLIYLVGVSIYQIYLWIKNGEKTEKRKKTKRGITKWQILSLY